jgi:hypothetical protein
VSRACPSNEAIVAALPQPHIQPVKIESILVRVVPRNRSDHHPVRIINRNKIFIIIVYCANEKKYAPIPLVSRRCRLQQENDR